LQAHENVALKPHLAESYSRFTHEAHPHAAATSQGTGEEKAACQAAHAQKALVGSERTHSFHFSAAVQPDFTLKLFLPHAHNAW
jgi:hypothetical protein